MALELRLSDSQLKDLAAIRDLGAVGIRRITETANAISPPPLDEELLIVTLGESLPDLRESARTLIQVALFLRTLQRQSHYQTGDIIQALRRGIDRAAKWSEQQVSAWTEIEPALLEFLNTRIIKLMAGVIDLSYDHASLLRTARILTEIRPIYNEDASSIEAAVVAYTLRLRYRGATGSSDDRDISVALDESDIRELRQQCDRALKKGEAARLMLSTLATIPTTAIGASKRD